MLRQAILAGHVYFLTAFVAGFLLGTVRVLALLPQFGELGAVLIEVPIMLAFCFWMCGQIVTRLGIGPFVLCRVVMGTVALLLLLLAEAGLAISLFDRSLWEHLDHYGTVSGALGLGAQFVFALFPVLWLRISP